MQNLECRYCGTNLGYLKNGGVYEVKPGQNHGPFSRVDNEGNPIAKSDIKPIEPTFKLTDRFPREVEVAVEASTLKYQSTLTDEPVEPTTETKIIEEPGSITCPGCGESNLVF